MDVYPLFWRVNMFLSEHRKEKRRIYNKRRYNERKAIGFKNNIILSGLEGTEGYENHHITKINIIALPSFVHREIPHGIDILNSGMLEINAIALNYLLSGI